MSTPQKLPMKFMAVSTLGSLLCAAGFYALFVQPGLFSRDLAGSLLAVGIAAEVWAVLLLLTHQRARQRGGD